MKISAITLLVISILTFQIQCTGSKTEKNKGTSCANGFGILSKTKNKTTLIDSMDRKISVYHGKTGSKDNMGGGFHSPARKVISISAPAIPLIVELGKTGTIRGLKLPAKSWHFEKIKTMMNAGDIQLVGNGSHSYINHEIILSVQPDLIFTNREFKGQLSNLLHEKNITVASIHTHRENSLMGQFEWIRFIGEFYNDGARAEIIFREKLGRYNKLKNKLSSVKNRTRVLWGSMVQHRASVPGGASFIANAVKDAGGKYALDIEMSAQTGAYIPLNMEVFYQKGTDSDILVLSSTKASGIKSISDIIKVNPMTRYFKAIKRGNVWCYHPCFWQSIHRPDEILEDIAAMLHPGLFPGHKFRFFEKLKMN